MLQRPVHERHPRLFHYTNLKGLGGILDTDTLWASDARALNDHTEIMHLKPLLVKIVYRIVNDAFRREGKDDFSRQRYFKKHGGLYALSLSEAKIIVDVFYDLTFTGRDVAEPFATPYVTSFCAHTNSSTYVKENGLLSQWRGYGGEGGFALVFNTQRLWDRLAIEAGAYDYSAFHFGDVVYDNGDIDYITDEFAELVEAFQRFVTQEMYGGDKEASAAYLFAPFFSSACRFKHEGFEEESEVRLVVSPTRPHILHRAVEQGAMLAEDLAEAEAKLKPILKRDPDIDCVVLNEVDKKKSLPIERIIVGPHRDQAEAVEKVRALLGSKNIPVTCSKTPYIPPK